MNQDLNLLKVFVVIAETLNLSKASEVLGLSQPSLSYALKKLRDEFNDPLFVREPYGFHPTPRAEQLLPQVQELLKKTNELYRVETLDLPKVDRTVNLAFTTYFEALILPKLIQILEKEAPLVKINTISLTGEVPRRELDSGEYDLAVAAYFENLPSSYYMLNLGKDPHVAVMRKKHPYLKSKKTLEDFLTYKHIKIGVPLHTESRIDQLLKRKGQARNIIGNFNNFFSPMLVLKQSDFILTVPSRLAQLYAEQMDLHVVELPTPDLFIKLKMVWHSRNHSDLFHQWLRRKIVDCF